MRYFYRSGHQAEIGDHVDLVTSLENARDLKHNYGILEDIINPMSTKSVEMNSRLGGCLFEFPFGNLLLDSIDEDIVLTSRADGSLPAIYKLNCRNGLHYYEDGNVVKIGDYISVDSAYFATVIHIDLDNIFIHYKHDTGGAESWHYMPCFDQNIRLIRRE